ncbi:CRISPR-associated protein Cas4 [Ferrimonas kyonanensis]|uniref:CRISPR-associated protein Cas4 n=1 Tax=Ferrimonas kyonanensis TaxID=364763 RepID=UPI00055758D7|nr:CRISPR-associated protein Cas4 [Ferrimonas kyonanensis]
MSDQRWIPLSALQHYAFCSRQCALIHNEQAWADNYLTAHGNLLHQRVDSGEPETRKGVRFERAVQVSAPSLRLIGKLDLVERELASGRLTPVEYKRGRPKSDRSDEIQLCAQALCLEEMLGISVDSGALWYWQSRRRVAVLLDSELRAQTFGVIAQVAALLDSGFTPEACFDGRCRACSLVELCQPKWSSEDVSLDYQQALFKEEQ